MPAWWTASSEFTLYISTQDIGAGVGCRGVAIRALRIADIALVRRRFACFLRVRHFWSQRNGSVDVVWLEVRVQETSLLEPMSPINKAYEYICIFSILCSSSKIGVDRGGSRWK